MSCVCAGVCLKVSCLDGQYRKERREWRGDKEGRNEDEEMIRREKRGRRKEREEKRIGDSEIENSIPLFSSPSF